jgi:hypothetical protein
MDVYCGTIVNHSNGELPVDCKNSEDFRGVDGWFDCLSDYSLRRGEKEKTRCKTSHFGKKELRGKFGKVEY